MVKVSLLSLLIRAGSIFSRFVLILYLGKHLPTGEYGIFGLLQSSLALGVYLMGLDLYVYTNREIPQLDSKGVQTVVRSQFAVHALCYCLCLPLILLMLSDHFIPSQYMIGFATLLLLEHLTFEIVRILIALRQPLYANLLILSRSLLWILPFLMLSAHHTDLLSIRTLLIFWVAGLSVALILGLGLLVNFKLLPFQTWKLDIPFVKAAARSSAIFFMASICYKTIEFSNRYFLKHYHTHHEVGIYSFFQNIVNLMDVFLYTAVVMILLPSLIASRGKEKPAVYAHRLHTLVAGIFYGTLLLSLALYLFIDPFLAFVGKEEMTANIDVFKWLLLGATLLCLSQIGHYILYIHKADKSILKASFIGAVVNTLLNFALIPAYGPRGAAISTMTACAVMGLLKLYYGRHYEPIRLRRILHTPSDLMRSMALKLNP